MEGGIKTLEDCVAKERLQVTQGLWDNSAFKTQKKSQQGHMGEPFGGTEGSVCKGSKVKQASRV